MWVFAGYAMWLQKTEPMLAAVFDKMSVKAIWDTHYSRSQKSVLRTFQYIIGMSSKNVNVLTLQTRVLAVKYLVIAWAQVIFYAIEIVVRCSGTQLKQGNSWNLGR